MIGISQERLGDLLGITFQQIQKYERGTNRVSASRLFHLASILSVPIGFFYEGISSGRLIESPPDPLSALNTVDGCRLATAYTAIDNAKIRVKLVELAEAMSHA
jgi:transcriptional regulator with XRE-family HTH domain